MEFYHRGINCKPYIPERRMENVRTNKRFPALPKIEEEEKPKEIELMTQSLEGMLKSCGVDCQRKWKTNWELIVLLLLIIVFF